jgi:hypothetical protein
MLRDIVSGPTMAVGRLEISMRRMATFTLATFVFLPSHSFAQNAADADRPAEVKPSISDVDYAPAEPATSNGHKLVCRFIKV